jgi:hypothetical protein
VGLTSAAKPIAAQATKTMLDKRENWTFFLIVSIRPFLFHNHLAAWPHAAPPVQHGLKSYEL